jgi:CDP-glycerol glycerophosphotransferase (TagB/SpsB family)
MSPRPVHLSLVLTLEGRPWRLRDALASVRPQLQPGAELVVVDSRRDEVASWIVEDELARWDRGTADRVRVVRRPDGPGGGAHLRQAGQDAAAGALVWHLDVATTLVDGAVGAMVATAREHPEADLIVAPVTEVRWWVAERGGRRRASPRLPSAVTDVVSTPRLLDGPLHLPSTIVRRGRLPAALPWSDPGGARGWQLRGRSVAGRIVVTGHVVAHVHLRGDHLARTAEPAPVDAVLAAYVDALSLVRQLGDPARTELLPDRARRAVAADLEARRAGWSREVEVAHLREVAARLDPLLPATSVRAPVREVIRRRGRRGSATLVERELLFRGHPAAHRALRRVLDLARRTRRRLRPDPDAPARPQRFSPAWRRALAYRAFRLLPLDRRLVVLAAYGCRKVACSPLAIAEELERRAPRVRTVWLLGAAVEAPPGVRVVRPGTLRCHWVTARAAVLVNNYNFGLGLVQRPGTLNIQTQHGTPLKTVGIDQHRFPKVRAGGALPGFVQRYQRWDVVLSTSRFNAEILHRSFPGAYRVVSTGFPRNDVLVRGAPHRAAATRARLGLAPDDVVVLYAPTFRDGRRGFASPLDVTALTAALDHRTKVLVRAHYFIGSAGLDADVEGRLVDVSAEPSIEDLYLAADVLVTDYSSAMFDFALLDRPIVLYVPDLDAYRRRRGLYFDLDRDGPGPLTTDLDELVSVLRDLPGDGAWRGQHRRFRDRFCEYEHGRAAERVVDELVLPHLLGHEPPSQPPGEQPGSGDSAVGAGGVVATVGST